MNLRVVVIRPSQDLQERAEEHVINCSNSITTVGELKAAIESELHITREQQKLFLLVNDGDNIKPENLQESGVYVEIEPFPSDDTSHSDDRKVVVREWLMDGTTKNYYAIVGVLETVANFRKKINAENKKILFNGNPLGDLSSPVLFNYLDKPRNVVDVWVEHQEANPTSSSSGLANRLGSSSSHIGSSASAPAQHLGASSSTTLSAVENQMEVRICPRGADCYPVQVYPSAPVYTLRLKYAELCRQRPNLNLPMGYNFSIKGDVLNDRQSFRDQNVRANERIIVTSTDKNFP